MNSRGNLGKSAIQTFSDPTDRTVSVVLIGGRTLPPSE